MDLQKLVETNEGFVAFGDCVTTMQHLIFQGHRAQVCVTSPPYFGLRDYGREGQIGLEQQASEYVKSLVRVFRSVYYLLEPDGVLFVNIGDTYAGYKDGKFPAQSHAKGDRRGLPASGAPHRNKILLQLDGFRDKELMGIPWRFALAMSESGWILRNEIVWAKQNYTPEKVRDRFVKSHEKIFMFVKQPHYKFDGDAVRVPSSTGTKLRSDVWSMPTTAYKGAHDATYPLELAETCVLAASQKGDVVFDPFMGSGTSAAAARKHDRRYLGCELNTDYAPLQMERITNAC